MNSLEEKIVSRADLVKRTFITKLVCIKDSECRVKWVALEVCRVSLAAATIVLHCLGLYKWGHIMKHCFSLFNLTLEHQWNSYMKVIYVILDINSALTLLVNLKSKSALVYKQFFLLSCFSDKTLSRGVFA